MHLIDDRDTREDGACEIPQRRNLRQRRELCRQCRGGTQRAPARVALTCMHPCSFEVRRWIIRNWTGIDKAENVRARHIEFSVCRIAAAARRVRRCRLARKSSVLIVPVVTPSARAMSRSGISSR